VSKNWYLWWNLQESRKAAVFVASTPLFQTASHKSWAGHIADGHNLVDVNWKEHWVEDGCGWKMDAGGRHTAQTSGAVCKSCTTQSNV